MDKPKPWCVSNRVFYVRLAAHVSNGWKSPIRPSGGKDTAKTKGVHREVESEGRWRQISVLGRHRDSGKCVSHGFTLRLCLEQEPWEKENLHQFIILVLNNTVNWKKENIFFVMVVMQQFWFYDMLLVCPQWILDYRLELHTNSQNHLIDLL